MSKLKKLFKWVKKYWYILVIIILLNTVLQFLYTYIPVMIQYAINVLENTNSNVNLPTWVINFFNSFEKPLTIVLVVALSIVFLQAFRSILRFIDNYLRAYGTEKVAYNMRNEFFQHFNDLSYAYHKNQDVGDLIQRSTTDIETSSTFIFSRFPFLLDIFVTLGLGAYQVGKINMTLMLVSLISIPISAISSIIWFNYSYKKYNEIEEEESKLTTIIQENVNSSRVVKAFANEAFEVSKMEKQNKKYRDKNISLGHKESMFWGFSDGIATIQYAVTISVGIYLAKQGVINTADIGAALLLIGMVIWPIKSLGRVVSEFGLAIVASKRIDEFLSVESEYTINGTLTPEIKGGIEFRNVSFKFTDTTDNLLENISFKINPGETIAIVGMTGSGKSTICNLIERFYETSSGEILIDNYNIKDIEKHHLRKNIQMVLQEPILFSRSIYENIAITNSEISKEKVLVSATDSQIMSEINKFEEGFETIVGEKGSTLSGGQKQRVAIARSIITDSKVLIFDDSLSALDTETDFKIRQSLKEKKKQQTLIIVTHCTPTAMEADRILVIEEGRVTHFKTHNELVNIPGLYSELWKIQGNLETDFNNREDINNG